MENIPIDKLSETLGVQNAESVKHIGSIGIGKNTTIKRLTLGGVHASLRIAAATKNELNFFSRTFLFTRIEGTDTFINIRSTAKRLGLTHDEVKDLAKEGKGKLTEAFEKRQAVLSQYEDIVNQYTLDLASRKLEKEATNENAKVTTALTPEVLLKTIQLGFKKLDEIPDKDIFFSEDLKQMHVFTQELGRGTFGVVSKTFDLIGKTFVAAKEAPRFQFDNPMSQEIEEAVSPQSQERMENEIFILKKLDHPGIQRAPSEITTITNTKGVKKTIYQTQLMTGGDLKINKIKLSPQMEKFYELSPKKQFQLFQAPVEGLAYTHQMNIVHRDIKPANFLIKVNDQGVPSQIILADFDAAEENANQKPLVISNKGTPFYMPREENNTLEQSDVFAFALSLIEIFTKGQQETGSSRQGTYPQTKENNRLGEKNHRLLMEKGVPQEMADLLMEGIGPKDDRPTSEQFKQRYNEILGRM